MSMPVVATIPSAGNTVTKNQAITDGLEAIRRAWREHLASEIDDSRLITLGGQVWGESQFGRAVESYKPIEWGTNNFGSIQAVPSWQAAHAQDAGWGFILLGDVHADGTPYVYPYRVYPTPMDAARDWLALITSHVSLADMASPVAFATALKRMGYYEAKVSDYIHMIAGGAMLCKNTLALGLPANDPDVPTDDAFPPNAFDGKKLPGRVTLFPIAAPTPHGYDVSTVRGQQWALAHLAATMGQPCFDPHGIDGVVGPNTRAAIVAFQHFEDISAADPLGVVGNETKAALLSELAAHP